MQHTEAQAQAGWSVHTPDIDVECPGGRGCGEALIAAAVVMCGSGDGEDVGGHSVTLHPWEYCILPPILQRLHSLIIEHKSNLKEKRTPI